MKQKEEPSGTWRAIKIVIAVVLLLGAGVYAMARFGALRPDPDVELPKSTQWMRLAAENINEDFQEGIEALNLTKEQREQMEQWMKAVQRGKTKEERRKQWRKLAEILTPEQQEQFRTLLKERREQRALLRAEQQNRMKRVMGEKDYEVHQENREKIREQRQRRIEEQRQAQIADQEREQ